MKYPSLIAAGLAAALSLNLPALADDAHHPAKASSAAAAKAPAPEQTVKKMQANLKKMQFQLDRLGKAKNEPEFQKILAEHMQTMQESMMLGEGMAGMDCAMMHGGMHGMMGGGMEQHGGMMDGGHEAMLQRMQQMEQRLERMQAQLEQMAKPASSH